MGAIGLSDIRYEDLLGRDSIKLECGSLDTVFGKTVLVSGGGGSIGRSGGGGSFGGGGGGGFGGGGGGAR